MEINVKKALKLKNKIVQKMNDNVSKVQMNNSALEGATRQYDPKESLESSISSMEELISLKTAIHAANYKVYGKIFRLSELKSFVKSLKSINCMNGLQGPGYMQTTGVNYTSIISKKEIDSMVEKYEAEIEEIQEELDIHNAKTKIKI